MSLVHDPDVLILDEPTVGLDPPGRAQLLNLIRDLRDEGRRILVSTHIMHDADFLCDDILLIDGGLVAYSGPVGDLVGTGAGVVVAMGQGLDGGFAESLTERGYTIRERDTERLAFEPGDDHDLREFWALAAQRGVEVRTLGREAPTLENAVVLAMERGRER
jgi:ABC-2 type transport system ATP-binding protein